MKQHGEFVDDLNYYLEFTDQYTSLDLFAGFGRVSNFLAKNGVDIEAVELDPNFAQSIQLPSEKIHVSDVLKFNTTKRYDRVISAYNSFCLLTNTDDIRKFFQQLDSLLKSGGKASLNYFPFKYWTDAPSGDIQYQNELVKYHSSHKKVDDKKAIWHDHYSFRNGLEQTHDYPVRIYSDKSEVEAFLSGTSLKLVDEVHDFKLPQEAISETGWVDYVLEKK